MPHALAFGWHVWTRHRLGLTLCGSYWLVMLILANTLPVSIAVLLFPSLFVVPCAVAFMYLVGIFSIGLDAHLEACESGFPARLWTLPLPTRSLVGWPMLWGTAVLALAWFTLSWGVLRTSGLDLGVLIWWPALLLSVTVAWLQAIVWSPFPLPGLRLAVAIPLACGVIIAPQFLIQLGLDESIGYGLLAAQLPMAYWIAVFGVSRARHGDVPRWAWPGWSVLLRWASATTVRRPFLAPERAQLWFEWRRWGFAFPLWMVGNVLVCLPMVPWIAWFFDKAARGGTLVVPAFLLDEIGSLWTALAGLLLLPPIMASACGLEIGKLPSRDRTRGLSSFLATRPVSVALLVRAKLEAAALSTLTGWSVFFVGLLLWFAFGGQAAEMMASFAALRQRHSPGPFWISLALLLGGTVLLTWLQMVKGMWLGLTGRAGAIACGVLGFAGLFGLILFGQWLVKSPEYWPTFSDLLPWLAGAVVVLKSLAGVLSLRTLSRRRLVPASVLGGALVIWFVLAAGLFGVLHWLIPREWVSMSALVLGIALVLPVTRLALAPLALAWNRHR